MSTKQATKPAKQTALAQLQTSLNAMFSPAAEDRDAVRAKRYPSQVKAADAAQAEATASAIDAAAQATSKARKSAKAAAVKAKPALHSAADVEAAELVAVAAGWQLEGDSVTERLWSLFNRMGKPGTFTRQTAVAAALEHGLNPNSATIAFGRWQATPNTPRAK